MLEKELEKIGLNENEAKIYLLALELGKSSIKELSEQSKIKRGTVYNVIDSLLQKGFLAIGHEKNRKVYIAESPSNLNLLFDVKQHELEERKKAFEKLFPELDILFNSSDVRPRVKYFEGNSGALSLKEEYLKTKSKKIDNILFYDNSFKSLPEAKKYTTERVKKKIKSRFLYISKIGRDLNLENGDKTELRESKYVPYASFPFNIDLSIFDEKIVIQHKKSDKFLAVLINNKEIADSFRLFFDLAWGKFESKK